jgi:hypothetical protein
VKEQRANITLTQGTLKGNWEQAIRTISTLVNAAYRQWSERNKKFVCIGDGYVEKSSELNLFLKVIILVLFT